MKLAQLSHKLPPGAILTNDSDRLRNEKRLFQPLYTPATLARKHHMQDIRANKADRYHVASKLEHIRRYLISNSDGSSNKLIPYEERKQQMEAHNRRSLKVLSSAYLNVFVCFCRHLFLQQE